MGAIQKVQLDVERVLAILESSRDIEELRVAKGMADVVLAAAQASKAVRANAQVMALCESADLRYRRALGEILARMPKAEGGRPSETGSTVRPVSEPTLSELGITKTDSSRCQRLATLPAPVFDAEVRAGVESGKLPTLSGLLKKADEAEVRRLSDDLTPDAREVVAGVALKPRDVRAILDAGAKAEPSKRALAEKQVASSIRSRQRSRGTGGGSAAATKEAEADDIATPKDIADAFLELNDEERAECLECMGCVAFATLRALREQRERDDSYKVNRKLSEPRPGAKDTAHVIAAVLDGGDASLALLGLDWSATPEQVKAAYHRAALIHHPDKGGDAARMADLSKAYTVALKYAERRGREAP